MASDDVVRSGGLVAESIPQIVVPYLGTLSGCRRSTR
jgi:hypothetical protein